MLVELLDEILEQVIEKCSFADVKNLSLTNCHLRQAVHKRLFRQLRIPETDIHDDMRRVNKKLPKKLRACRETRSLKLMSLHFNLQKCIYRAVSQMDSLERLDLSNVKSVCDSNLLVLSQCSLRLKSLGLKNAAVSGEGITHLASLTTLDSLLLLGCSGINDKGMRAISGFNLKLLVLGLCSGITTAGFRQIDNLVNLEKLQIFGCDIDDSTVLRLCSLTKLTKLIIGDKLHRISDTGFRDIANLINLEELGLCCDISDSGFLKVCTLSKLVKLNITGCREITSAGFRDIGKLFRLQELDMTGCCVDDDAPISQLRNLNKLDISDCSQISHLGLSVLKRSFGPFLVL